MQYTLDFLYDKLQPTILYNNTVFDFVQPKIGNFIAISQQIVHIF